MKKLFISFMLILSANSMAMSSKNYYAPLAPIEKRSPSSKKNFLQALKRRDVSDLIMYFGDLNKTAVKDIVNKNYEGFTPLQYALAHDFDDKIVEFLLKNGAKPNVTILRTSTHIKIGGCACKTYRGWTSAHIAVAANASPAVLKLLKSYGCDFDRKDVFFRGGWTARLLARFLEIDLSVLDDAPKIEKKIKNSSADEEFSIMSSVSSEDEDEEPEDSEAKDPPYEEKKVDLSVVETDEGKCTIL